jgi:transglutaminase-like putative cysteine protease
MDEREPSPGKCLQTTRFIDGDHPVVASFTESVVAGASNDRERAVRLFYEVRDRIRYDPYLSDASPDRFKASTTLQIGATFCIPKAILLTACTRAAGIPARLRFADVRNHLATRRLLGLLKSDLFVFHGYTELWLDGSWIKATPTFNLALCEKFGVRPLEFDGRSDAIFHAFDRNGQRHMEYVRDRGAYTDLPFDVVLRAYRTAYPHLFDGQGRFVGIGTSQDDFEAEAAEEKE